MKSREGCFVDNMKLPIHRWFRYSAGFSAEWVEDVVSDLQLDENSAVLDPFCGSGTTILACERAGVPSWGFESHPFVYRIARAKLLWHANASSFLKASEKTLQHAQKQDLVELSETPPLLAKCYSPTAFQKLTALKNSYVALRTPHSQVWDLVWLALTSILRPTSSAGTAQWQYVLPNKQKASVLDAFDAFYAKAHLMAEDMVWAQNNGMEDCGTVLDVDAREPKALDAPLFDAVITSPPYPNNYDYADATRLELVFWGEVNGWSGLQRNIRRFLIRSCSQHSAAERLQLDELLSNTLLEPIEEEVRNVCKELAEVRLTKGGKKTYHTMIAAYFLDMAKILRNLRLLMKPGSRLCYVIGDSAPYGVYAPADLWLGKLAISAGFRSHSFEKIRDRNVKWKNRKHRVPLKEGRLWIEG
jgi:DNA modification methylase